MGRVRPRLVRVFVALQTVLVVVQHFSVDKVSRSGAGERGLKIIRALGPFASPRAGILCLHHEHQCREASRHAGPLGSNFPFDASSRKSVQDKHPRGHQRGRHVGPIRRRTPSVVGEIQPKPAQVDAGQGDTRNERQNGRQEGRPTRSNRLTIGAVVGVSQVDQTKHNRGHHDQEPQDQVQQEHPKVEPALSLFALDGDRHQIHRIDDDQRKQRKHDGQNRLQTFSDRRSEFFRFGHGSILDRVSDGTTPTSRARNYSPPCQRVRRPNSRERPNSSIFRGGPGKSCSPSLVKRSISLHQPRVLNTTR